MTLNLTVTHYAGKAPAWPPAVTFAHRAGTIGRRSDCDWVLADPDGHISKQHCRIDFISGRYRITDTSTNGLFLNNRDVPLGFGVSAELKDGDVLFIGEYDIAVSLVMTEEPAAAPGRRNLPEPIVLVEALLRGADLPAEILDQTDAETLMHEAGARLRALIPGLRRLISQRDIAAADDAFRRDDDNEQALLALLVRGQSKKPDVFRRSFAALQAREAADLETARAAMAALLAPFLPEAIKARIETRTLLAAATKAKYWDLIETQFKAFHDARPAMDPHLPESADDTVMLDPATPDRRTPKPVV